MAPGAVSGPPLAARQPGACCFLAKRFSDVYLTLYTVLRAVSTRCLVAMAAAQPPVPLIIQALPLAGIV